MFYKEATFNYKYIAIESLSILTVVVKMPKVYGANWFGWDW